MTKSKAINISDIIKSDTFDAVDKILFDLNSQHQSQKKFMKQLTLKKVVAIRKIIKLVRRYPGPKIKLEKKIGKKIDINSKKFHPILEFYLFPNIKKRTPYVSKTLTLHNHVQNIAISKTMDERELLSECQKPNGLRGLVERYGVTKGKKGKSKTNGNVNAKNKGAAQAKADDKKVSEKNSKQQAEANDTKQKDGKIEFKKLKGILKFQDERKRVRRVIIANHCDDGKTRKLFEWLGKDADKVKRQFLKQIMEK